MSGTVPSSRALRTTPQGAPESCGTLDERGQAGLGTVAATLSGLRSRERDAMPAHGLKPRERELHDAFLAMACHLHGSTDWADVEQAVERLFARKAAGPCPLPRAGRAAPLGRLG